MTDQPVLAIEDLWVELGAAPLLRGVDLVVRPGQVAGLVGESGAGKSMIGRSILGLLPAGARVTHGTIRFRGQDLVGQPTARHRQLLGRGMTLIPQDPMTSLNPVHRIDRHMLDVLRLRMGLNRAAAQDRALALLEEVHIRDPEAILRRYPHELSGGMRQRILIAIAFACEPALIVADEPTTALDVTVQRQILRLIKELQASHGTAILFVTHDLGVVAKVCDTVTVLHAGRVVEQASAADIMTEPRHPYTRALLDATPRHDRPADALHPVPVDLSDRLHAEAAAIRRGSGSREGRATR